LVQKGAYLLKLLLKKSTTIDAGSLKGIFLPKGKYIYVGSARGGIERRISRHRRLAQTKIG
jgi:Uri superfamily endonuclease